MESKLMKDIFKEKIKEVPEEWISVKELAGIIGFSSAKIYKDYHNGNMKGVIQSGKRKGATLIIPKDIALIYIDFVF
jgi:DNA-binding transcriptional regulator YhcF (GntR family)